MQGPNYKGSPHTYSRATTSTLGSSRSSHLQASLPAIAVYQLLVIALPGYTCQCCLRKSRWSAEGAMKKLIIPTLMDTYGLIKFWDFDSGAPASVSLTTRGRVELSVPVGNIMPGERYKWKSRLLQVGSLLLEIFYYIYYYH